MLVGFTVRTTRNFDDERLKDVRADSRSGKIKRRFVKRDAMSSIVNVELG